MKTYLTADGNFEIEFPAIYAETPVGGFDICIRSSGAYGSKKSNTTDRSAEVRQKVFLHILKHLKETAFPFDYYGQADSFSHYDKGCATSYTRTMFRRKDNQSFVYQRDAKVFREAIETAMSTYRVKE